jgi:hypothetical protein
MALRNLLRPAPDLHPSDSWVGRIGFFRDDDFGSRLLLKLLKGGPPFANYEPNLIVRVVKLLVDGGLNCVVFGTRSMSINFMMAVPIPIATEWIRPFEQNVVDATDCC